MHTFSIDVHSLQETQLFGVQLAEVLRIGDVIALIGDLGAGKTHLTQAIAKQLGVDPEEVNSPTFVLIQEYDGDVPVCHIDAYRLNDTDEFLELGADELLGADNICLIEWADRVADVLPKRLIRIEIETIGETSRRISLKCPLDREAEIRNKVCSSEESKSSDG
ncbi:tRNA (adenosine(37)-N6)-threonylcarbamoyltransferase complex ATPase subunit type 1 TsaE [Planctomicrobium sp.]|jgi:tRNA threonylcarbamoyladenosine biosynthesis protein TsaE|nr:tRNA (adenosine(37)-N6)-threonylcarbamoyltransferase complex ATPase subunit type 1 TsaE [Planctomicrobium sp.]MBT5020530.1 tRNA (adenosine(37)-N6)-threonylcarbamoyltransferase complex ATPase subunit type 1 TsaE [Planctomicrobium sp.]MDB4743237.1 tRNA (adenosine(37)-N6)-threonylcarbamoyltransferase complex ATPase subunit type 1 TsaE [Planctomicrobium sp.]